MVDRSEVTLTGDNLIVSEVIHQYERRLATHGFEFLGVQLEESEVLEPTPVFRFHSRRTGIWLYIDFLAARAGLGGGFGVLLVKPVNRKLDVEDYLKLHGREDLARHFNYRDPATDIRAFARTFLDMLDDVFQRELQRVLEGKVFEETPIDWGDYR